MSEAFTKWDVTEDLRTKEDARLYLEACAEEDPRGWQSHPGRAE